MQKISKDGLRLIEQWEEFVPYVYDDLVPKRRINGKLAYPEWRGGPVRGTLTIGFGHTDAAGPPYITQGLQISRQHGDEILDADLDPCEQAVRTTVRQPLTQHQFDALVSFTFNCGAGALKQLVRDLNARGDYDSVPRRMMQYVNAKGKRLPGLVNRRSAEVRLWSTPDDPDAASSMVVPTAERAQPSKSMTERTTGGAAVATGAGGVVVAAQTIGDAASTVKSAKDNVASLGIMDYLTTAAHNPLFWVAVIIIVAGVYIWWDRRRRLREELL